MIAKDQASYGDAPDTRAKRTLRLRWIEGDTMIAEDQASCSDISDTRLENPAYKIDWRRYDNGRGPGVTGRGIRQQ